MNQSNELMQDNSDNSQVANNYSELVLEIKDPCFLSFTG